MAFVPTAQSVGAFADAKRGDDAYENAAKEELGPITREANPERIAHCDNGERTGDAPEHDGSYFVWRFHDAPFNAV